MADDEMGGEQLVVGGVKITVTRKIFFLWRATDDWCREFNFQNSYGAHYTHTITRVELKPTIMNGATSDKDKEECYRSLLVFSFRVSVAKTKPYCHLRDTKWAKKSRSFVNWDAQR